MPRRPGALTFLAWIVASFLLVACSATGSASTRPAASPGAAGGEPAASGGEGAAPGEGAASASYVNTRFGYSINPPGPMIEATDGSAAYVTAGERLDITVVTGGPAADPMALAKANLAALQSSPGYKLVSAPSQVTIAGRAVVKFVYESLVGSNPVTGKPYRYTNARYYIPRDAGRLAVLAYASFSPDYDPQNADDLESSFAWR